MSCLGKAWCGLLRGWHQPRNETQRAKEKVFYLFFWQILGELYKSRLVGWVDVWMVGWLVGWDPPRYGGWVQDNQKLPRSQLYILRINNNNGENIALNYCILFRASWAEKSRQSWRRDETLYFEWMTYWRWRGFSVLLSHSSSCWLWTGNFDWQKVSILLLRILLTRKIQSMSLF